jgi:hypothetical protein
MRESPALLAIGLSNLGTGVAALARLLIEGTNTASRER